MVGEEWFRMPLPLTARLLDYVHPLQLRQPHEHKHHSVAMRLISFLCTVGWKHADADCSCLFAESWWLNAANSTACDLPEQEEMELPAIGTLQCGSMGSAAVGRQREINLV